MLSLVKKKIKQYFPDLTTAYQQLRISNEIKQYCLAVTPYGFKFIGPRKMQDGSYEPEETTLIRKYLKECDIFVDVGANLGFFTCLARSIGKKTVAIEPLQQNLHCLYANLVANDWTDIEVFPLGLSMRPGTGKIYGGGTGASLRLKWAGISEKWHQTIPLSTLDIVVSDRFAGQRLFIKMDVEGAEYDVLRGAARVLALSPSPIWLLEICLTEHHSEGINPNYSKIFELYWEYGFQAYAVGKDLTPVSPSDVEQWLRTREKEFGYVSYLFTKQPTDSPTTCPGS